MRKFNVTVNGVSYEVEIEEVGGNSTQNTTYTAPSAPPVQAAPPAPAVSAPPQPQAPPAPAKPPVGAAGGQKVVAPMPGKIITIYFAQGQAVKKGEPVVILEAMKMQNELLSPCDGVVQALNVAEGQNVKSGEVIMVVG
ncbi:biotin/lipoyl-binding protein [Selenomonadales bacterium OttesenSCG-928-I06]|nr:biotin/lipoyl-binding protein [Selenomonadales bacterium OttesenSCG-928-I06]